MKNFYIDISACIASGDCSEAYVLVGKRLVGVGPTALEQMLGDLSSDYVPLDRLKADYHTLLRGRNQVVFADAASGFVDVAGVLVEFFVSKVAADKYGVLFKRLDAAQLLLTTQNRLAKLEAAVTTLAAQAR
jgi:hypothetical protein